MGRFRLVAKLLAAVLAVGVAVSFAGRASAQNGPSDQPDATPQTKSPSDGLVPAVHSVRIDAIATNARGAIVSTLKPADFELREDGQLLPVDEARFVSSNPAPGSAPEDVPQPVRSAADERREAHGGGGRLLAIYLDEYHISAGTSADRAREALTELVDRELGPRDLLVVMKPLDSLFAIRFTHDRDEARRIIAGLEGRKGDYVPRTTYERSYMAGSPARIETARTQVAISALNALAVHMGSLNDLRKTLLMVSEGFDRVPRRRGQEYLSTIDSVIRSANRATVSIYPVDPRPADADRTADAEDTGLRSLATETDGRMVSSADSLSAAVRGALADGNAYYVLKYHNAHQEDGAFHPVQVRVKRAGVLLRARSGYWAPSPEDRLRAELVAKASRPPVVVPPEPVRHISPLVQPWFGMSLGADGKTRLTFVWEPSVVVPGDRARRTAARLELTALGSGTTVLFQGAVLPVGSVAAEESGGEPSRAIFEAPPGRLRLRMKIQDAARLEVDSDVREITVRDLRATVSIGTPEFLRARNAREFRTLVDDPHAVPVSSREFSRTERLLIRFPAYAPNGQPPSVSARLLNRMGQPMRTLVVQPAADGAHEVEILLAGLPSGDYQLELAAASPAGRAMELMGFRVTS